MMVLSIKIQKKRLIAKKQKGKEKEKETRGVAPWVEPLKGILWEFEGNVGILNLL